MCYSVFICVCVTVVCAPAYVGRTGYLLPCFRYQSSNLSVRDLFNVVPGGKLLAWFYGYCIKTWLCMVAVCMYYGSCVCIHS